MYKFRTYVIVFLGRMFILIRALCSFFLGASVMKPPALLGVGAVCCGGCLEGEGGIGASGGGGGGGTSSLCLGSDCMRAISTGFRPLARGDVSGVCSISLKAVKINLYRLHRSLKTQQQIS